MLSPPTWWGRRRVRDAVNLALQNLACELARQGALVNAGHLTHPSALSLSWGVCRPFTQQFRFRHSTTGNRLDCLGVLRFPRPLRARQLSCGLPFPNGLVRNLQRSCHDGQADDVDGTLQRVAILGRW